MSQKLTINGKEVLLPEGFSINVTCKNNMFSELEIFSLPVSLPYDANKHIVNFIGNIQSYSTRNASPIVEYFENGNSIIRGIGKYQSLGDKLKIVIKGNEYEFSTQINNLSFADLDWPELLPAYPTEADITTLMNGCIDGSKPYVCFPVRNLFDFEGNNGVFERNFYNKWNFYTQAFEYSTDDQYGHTVFFKLHEVLNKMFSLLGYHVTYNYFENLPQPYVIICFAEFTTYTSYAQTWLYFLPSLSISEFIEQIKSWGIKFDIDTAAGTVQIKRYNNSLDEAPKNLSNWIDGSLEQEFIEAKDGYILSTKRTNEAYAPAYLDLPYFAQEQLMTFAVDTPNDLPAGTEGNFRFVKSTGVLMHYVSGEWVPKQITFGDVYNSQYLNTANNNAKHEVTIDPCFNTQLTNHDINGNPDTGVEDYPNYTASNEHYSAPCFNLNPVEDGVETSTWFVSIYRGLQPAHGSVEWQTHDVEGTPYYDTGNIPAQYINCPLASLLAYAHDGSTLTGQISLTSGGTGGLIDNLRNYLELITSYFKIKLKVDAGNLFFKTLKNTSNWIFKGRLCVTESISSKFDGSNTKQISVMFRTQDD